MTKENDRGFCEFVGWCDRNIVSGTHDRKFIDILAKEDMARIYSYIKDGLKKKDDLMNTALNDSKRFRINEEEIYKNDMCTCNHERKDHRKNVMINSSQLGCGLCECRWFKMSAGKSNSL